MSAVLAYGGHKHVRCWEEYKDPALINGSGDDTQHTICGFVCYVRVSHFRWDLSYSNAPYGFLEFGVN